MNLFDFTYCGNYNRQIQNLARMVPEKWSFGESNDNGILKGYLEYTFKRVYEEKKVIKSYSFLTQKPIIYLYSPIRITAIRKKFKNIFPTSLSGLIYNLDEVYIE